MKSILLIAALFMSTTAMAKRYYYNPAHPNQPGSYNHHKRSSYNTALKSVAVTKVITPGGNVYSGSPGLSSKKSGKQHVAPGKIAPRAPRGYSSAVKKLLAQQLNLPRGSKLTLRTSLFKTYTGKRYDQRRTGTLKVMHGGNLLKQLSVDFMLTRSGKVSRLKVFKPTAFMATTGYR